MTTERCCHSEPAPEGAGARNQDLRSRPEGGESLPAPWDVLLAAAREVAKHAYAPYSHLHIGAALQGESGQIYRGCNVENASYGLTICAERAAVFAAVVAGEQGFAGLAISTPDAGPLSPCGACRQVLAEFAQDLEIVSEGKNGETRTFQLSALLPEVFRRAGTPTDR